MNPKIVNYSRKT